METAGSCALGLISGGRRRLPTAPTGPSAATSTSSAPKGDRCPRSTLTRHDHSGGGPNTTPCYRNPFTTHRAKQAPPPIAGERRSAPAPRGAGAGSHPDCPRAPVPIANPAGPPPRADPANIVGLLSPAQISRRATSPPHGAPTATCQSTLLYLSYVNSVGRHGNTDLAEACATPDPRERAQVFASDAPARRGPLLARSTGRVTPCDAAPTASRTGPRALARTRGAHTHQTPYEAGPRDPHRP